MQRAISDHNEVKLEINNGRIILNSPNTWKQNTLPNNPWFKEEISRRKFKCID